MTPGIVLSFMSALLGLVAAQPGAMEQGVTRLAMQDEVILRVTIQPRPARPVEWIERKGPKCVPVGAIRAAILSGTDHVDFIFANHARVRAEVEEGCAALDFYGSFYLQPDGERICAGRDEIHSRMGGSCMIERFKLLLPKFAGH